MGAQIPCRHFQEMACFEQITQYKGEEKVRGWRRQKRERVRRDEAPGFSEPNPRVSDDQRKALKNGGQRKNPTL